MPSISNALVAALFLFAGIGTAPADADDYPNRAIRVVVPYAAGGPSDTGARLAAEALSRVLSKPVIVENRGGGGGLNATEAYLATEPDGYTILVGAIGPFTIMPAAKHVAYDVEKDFIPLGTVWRSAQVLAVRRDLGVSTVADFVAKAKQNPGTLTIASAGVGAVTHLAIELLKREAGIDVIHVPFRSTGETLPSLMGGQIDALFGDAPILAPQVHAGKIQALAVAAPKRALALPEIPTMGEAGLPGVIAESWYGFVVSAKTPPAIVQRLQQALATAQDDPTYKENLARQGASAGDHGPAPFAQLITTDAAKWRAIVTAAGIRLD
ncbi:MAG TPA: tripartite tricarboxylate transporter substrate binding protein [Xanthobacteraceae bacterium]